MSDETPREPASVYEHLATMLDQIAAVSWQKLGLQPDIMSGKIQTNLGEAKVAIDLAAHLAAILDGQLDEADRRQVQRLVSDLRLNFVQKGKEAGS